LSFPCKTVIMRGIGINSLKKFCKMKNSEKGEYVNYRSYWVLPQNSNNARYKLFFTNSSVITYNANLNWNNFFIKWKKFKIFLIFDFLSIHTSKICKNGKLKKCKMKTQKVLWKILWKNFAKWKTQESTRKKIIEKIIR
jgi:hypothetical protein